MRCKAHKNKKKQKKERYNIMKKENNVINNQKLNNNTQNNQVVKEERIIRMTTKKSVLIKTAIIQFLGMALLAAALDSKYNNCEVRFIGNLDFELSPATPAMERELEEEVKRQLAEEDE